MKMYYIDYFDSEGGVHIDTTEREAESLTEALSFAKCELANRPDLSDAEYCVIGVLK